MEILKVSNLVKSYGKGKNIVNAVDDVSFSVQKGEFVAVVGASGSGKSTLMHLIGGVDKKDSGEIIINDVNISKLSIDKLAVFRRKNIGIVYQFYNLLPILTTEENISVPVLLDNKKIDKERLDEMINILGLNKRRKNLPNQMSGGEQQRVSIGRALIAKPSILLADEPTGNLDSKNSEEIMKLLQKYNKEYGQTIIMITHNPDLAKKADRIITMADGKIISDKKN